MLNDRSEERCCVGGGDDVIYTEEKVGNLGPSVKNKQRIVTFGGYKTKSVNIGCEMNKPSAGSLFETIEEFVGTSHMCRIGGVNKTRGLLAVNCISVLAMKKRILDIHLMNVPRVSIDDVKDAMNSCRLDNRAKCLAVIDTRILRETTDHPSSLVP
jgi:hypothetical protein